eukprot:TRINITY_DN3138_c0_g1_i4.p1 TRINITY_DN3138_c0_g1~~TRINITY_DN3138_c0_g1_i4.p1  ORF type:complete len:649 (-),score=40.19 TRINITY_DN3138_c0_g1_i4:431-2377(-)
MVQVKKQNLTFQLFFAIACSAQVSTGCPPGCVDEQPPTALHDCNIIANVFQACGSDITSGDRYCKCSCQTCPGMQSSTLLKAQIKPNHEEWFLIEESNSYSFQSFQDLVPRVSNPIPPITDLSTIPPPPSPSPSPTPSSSPPSDFMQISKKTIGDSGGTVSENAWSASTVNVASDRQPLTLGGAQDINAFRQAINDNKQPSQDDITYEGMFNEYYFDVSDGPQCDQILCVKYNVAVSQFPLTEHPSYEPYLAMATQLRVQQEDFQRKDLDLVIVLDISGSMSESIGRRLPFWGFLGFDPGYGSKIDVAKQAINDIINQLTPNDRLGIVTFESSADVIQQLEFVTDTKKAEITRRVQYISTKGYTNLEDGLNKAVGLMTQDSRQNRLMVITDARPNEGEFDSEALATFVKEYALREDPIYTTIIGVGTDFNTALAEKMAQARGANYLVVADPSQFETVANEEFKYLVSPLVFDLSIKLNRDSWYIAQVYGVPRLADNKETLTDGEILKVSTQFASRGTAEGSKGGIILIKLFSIDTSAPLYFTISYYDQDLKPYNFSYRINQFSQIDNLQQQSEYYGSTAIRKAIVLSRYVQFMKESWLDKISATELTVAQDIGNQFSRLAIYILDENDEIQDPQLQQEVDLLQKLAAS